MAENCRVNDFIGMRNFYFARCTSIGILFAFAVSHLRVSLVACVAYVIATPPPCLSVFSQGRAGPPSETPLLSILVSTGQIV